MSKISNMTVAMSFPPCDAGAKPCRVRAQQKRFHRVATVRREQEVSLRSAARRAGWSLPEVRAKEDETRDLCVSDLLKWQQVLDVPLLDLLLDPEPTLSRPVMERARLLRLMKTVLALREIVSGARSQRLVSRLVGQLVEIMPELENANAWPSVGKPRQTDEFGLIAERVYVQPM